MEKNIIAIIPARSGSKNPPDKNILLLRGKPLLCHSIEHAKKSRLIKRCIVSTDSEKYAKIARKCGAEAPFLRPKEISGDLSTDLEAFTHALKWLKDNEDYEPDILVHLRPTSPFRKPEQIDDAIRMLIRDPNADSLRSVVVPKQNPFKMWRIEGKYLKPILELKGMKEPYNAPRQALPGIYWQNACIDITRRETILNKKSMTGDKIMPFIMEDYYDMDIDSKADVDIARERVKSAGGDF